MSAHLPSKRTLLGAIAVLSTVAFCFTVDAVDASKLNPALKPGQNFNLTQFKLQLPITSGNGVLEILPQQLTTYASEFFFSDKTTGAMVMWVPSNGAHTSGSKFPRTELRSIKDFTISTANTSLTVAMAVLQTPKRNNVVIGQLKGESDQPLELRWMDGSIVASVKPVFKQTTTPDYAIVKGLKEGEPFTYTMTAKAGTVVVTVNDVPKTIVFDKSWNADKVYWKFGNYCQDNSAVPNNSAKVAVFSFSMK
jgi:Alginate lyase